MSLFIWLGHGVGGLMIRTALMSHGTGLWPKVGKIDFLATPHYGSVSITGYLKNHLREQLAVLGIADQRHGPRDSYDALKWNPTGLACKNGEKMIYR